MNKYDLKRIVYLDKRIDSSIREIEKLKEYRSMLRPLTFDNIRVQTSNISDPTAERVQKIMAIEERVGKEIDELIDLREDLKKSIYEVKDEQLRLLLQYRYIEGLSFEEIAIRMNYGIRHIWRLHGKALWEISNENVSVNVT